MLLGHYLGKSWMTNVADNKKWYLWVSDKTSDKPLICKTGGMIGINGEAILKLQQAINELVDIWDERIKSTTDDPRND